MLSASFEDGSFRNGFGPNTGFAMDLHSSLSASGMPSPGDPILVFLLVLALPQLYELLRTVRLICYQS